LLGSTVPIFGECLRDLQQTRLKYSVLLDRIRKIAPMPFRQALLGERLLDQLGIVNDLKRGEFLGNQQPSQMTTLNNQLQHQPTFGKALKSHGDSSVAKQEDSMREIQRIKEQLGGAESKLKDAQLTRLQEKVKSFAKTEKTLRQTISEIEQRDESLVSKLENALCFGKVMVTQRPLLVKSFASLLSAVQRTAIDIPFQQQLQNQSSQVLS